MVELQSIQSMREIQECINNEEVAIFLVKTKNCSVCNAIEEQINNGMILNKEVLLRKVSLEKVPELSGKYLVFTAPTILLFIEGKEHWRGARFILFDELNQMIDRYFA